MTKPLLVRREFLGRLLAAPAVIRSPGLLMPVKVPKVIDGMRVGMRWNYLTIDEFTREKIIHFINSNTFASMKIIEEQYSMLSGDAQDIELAPALRVCLPEDWIVTDGK